MLKKVLIKFHDFFHLCIEIGPECYFLVLVLLLFAVNSFLILCVFNCHNLNLIRFYVRDFIEKETMFGERFNVQHPTKLN